MCLIVVAHRAHPDHRLVVAANRDELHARPTAPAGWWGDAPDLLAGRDLSAGGTWMGITRGGRFAAVTNFREWPPEPAERSRGHLVAGFLRADASPEAYGREVLREGKRYAGFNLLLGDRETMAYLSNRSDPRVRVLEPGVHALSNHLLDSPWPKVRRARRAMDDALAASGDTWDATLWEMLADRVVAADDDLPDTGMGLDRERLLSPPFIAGAEYGTRASTVLTVSADGEVRFVERSVVPGQDGWTEARHSFRIVGG